MTSRDGLLRSLAAVVDEASVAESSYEAARNIHAQIPILEDLPSAAPLDLEGALRQAVSWAFGYRIKVAHLDQKWRVLVEPYFKGASGETIPPGLDVISSDVVKIWDELAGEVTSPFAVARLRHLLFEKNFGNAREHAIASASAYMERAATWPLGLNRAKYLSIALRLARAVGDRGLVNATTNAMLDDILSITSSEVGMPGVVLDMLRPLVDEKPRPDRLAEVMAATRDCYSDPFILDEVLALQIKHATGADRESLERERVKIWHDAAERAQGIIRAGHLKRAMEVAQASSQPHLAERAAAALQKIRDEDLGLATFSASRQIDEKQIEEILSPITRSSSWREGLLALVSAFGPATGPVERNREQADRFAREFVFSSLFSRELLGGDGLPRFTPSNDSDLTEMRLIEQEVHALQVMAPIVSMALSKVVEVHGIPSEGELTEFFKGGPLTDGELAASISRAITRFWSGDPEGAAFTIAPKIERLARELVLSVDAGVYRIQRGDKPGQYPGLGYLLGVLRDHNLDESWYRNILTVCGNPAGGWNLRNEMAHGFIDGINYVGAAVLIQSVLYLWLLGPNAESDSEASDS